MRGPAFFAYADNYLIDVKFGVIVDVEASRAIRQAEVGAAKTMIDRTEDRFGLKPARLAADTAYGSAATLDWIVNAKKIAPHIPVFDKSRRDDRLIRAEKTSRSTPVATSMLPARQAAAHDRPASMMAGRLLYRARTSDCVLPCPLKARCCPKAPERNPRSIYEDARDVARALAGTEAFEQSRHDRKRVEMLFAHLKRILKTGSPSASWPARRQDEFDAGRHCTEPAPARPVSRQATADSRSLPCLGNHDVTIHRAMATPSDTAAEKDRSRKSAA